MNAGYFSLPELSSPYTRVWILFLPSNSQIICIVFKLVILILVPNFLLFHPSFSLGYDDEDPKGVPYRILLFSLLLSVLVLHVSYSSYLITKVTTKQYNLPFRDLEGLYQKRQEFTFGVEANTFAEATIRVWGYDWMQCTWNSTQKTAWLSVFHSVLTKCMKNKWIWQFSSFSSSH